MVRTGSSLTIFLSAVLRMGDSELAWSCTQNPPLQFLQRGRPPLNVTYCHHGSIQYEAGRMAVNMLIFMLELCPKGHGCFYIT